MKRKYLYLAFALIATFIFVGYFRQSGPRVIFGYTINIWVVRVVWLYIAISNFFRFYKLTKAGK